MTLTLNRSSMKQILTKFIFLSVFYEIAGWLQNFSITDLEWTSVTVPPKSLGRVPSAISLITDQEALPVIEKWLPTETNYPILYGFNSIHLKLFFSFFFASGYPHPPFLAKSLSWRRKQERWISSFSEVLPPQRKYKPPARAHWTSKPSSPTNTYTCPYAYPCSAILSSLQPWASKPLCSGDILSTLGTSQRGSLSSHFPLASTFWHIRALFGKIQP